MIVCTQAQDLFEGSACLLAPAEGGEDEAAVERG
jgi:hypothetical protein